MLINVFHCNNIPSIQQIKGYPTWALFVGFVSNNSICLQGRTQGLGVGGAAVLYQNLRNKKRGRKSKKKAICFFSISHIIVIQGGGRKFEISY